MSRAGGAHAACEQPHAVVIDGTTVALTLRRSARRSFALQVDHRGARVAVPLRTSLAEVDRFVLEHGRWLLERLQARAQRPPPQALEGGAAPPAEELPAPPSMVAPPEAPEGEIPPPVTVAPPEAPDQPMP